MSSADASSIERPSARRATTPSTCARTFAPSAGVRGIGTQRRRDSGSSVTVAGLTGHDGNTTSGMTPTIVYGRPARRISRPTTSARPPNQSRHRPCDRMTTRAAPGSPSAVVKSRPIAGPMASVEQ
jgi:hypothetical protein